MYKCAIYTRVSTEEQAENPEGSIKNQELRLREFVKLKNMVAPFGDVAAVFSDPGVSAKDMNRPAFQQLLRAIEDGNVNLVLVTELSRFTRSMKDFSLLQEFLKKHGCEFLSMRENFDSSSATGNLVMTIMATLAEFERKQTAERISNSFYERAKRGLYNGGSIPLGYRIGEGRPGGLLAVPEEAALVRQVFETFLNEETLAATAKRLNSDGVLFPRGVRGSGAARGRIWQINMLQQLLHHKGYIGVRVFKDKKGNIHEAKAAWEPIIDVETFERVAKLLEKNHHRRRKYGTSRYPYTLSGLFFCRVCGHRLAGKSAHGRGGKIAYYAHSYPEKIQTALKERVKICDGNHHRIQAVKIEPLIWKDVADFLTGNLAKELIAQAKSTSPNDPVKSRREKLEAAAAKVAAQIEALAERIAELPKGIDPQSLYGQLQRLQANKEAIATELAVTDGSPLTDEIVSLQSLEAFTAGLKKRIEHGDTNPELQAAVIQKIVERIELLPDGYEISFHIGRNHYRAELGSAPGSAIFHGATAVSRRQVAKNKRPASRREPFLTANQKKNVSGSTFLLNGGRCRTRTCDLFHVKETRYQLRQATNSKRDRA